MYNARGVWKTNQKKTLAVDMERLFSEYSENVKAFARELRTEENFDVIKRTLRAGEDEVTLFYIDGFVKDMQLEKLMQYFVGLTEIGGAGELMKKLPQVEAEVQRDPKALLLGVLSGQTLMLSSRFFENAILLDLRTYPVRSVGEPDSDRVMQGARDGFVETLVVNTALIRRRVRDPRLVMSHYNLGGSSGTDVVVCYLEGVADKRMLDTVKKKIESLSPRSLTLGFQSLAECLIPRGWLNPFPKIRTTERPDTASAQVLEGSILVICDTSPQVMILPTSIFDYLQQTDDYYFPPLTGTYMRFVRTVILLFSVVCTPLWVLALEYEGILPEALSFVIPDEPGALPIIWQLFLAEFAIDGLKIASLNTPSTLSNSLSVVGALILGDFAVGVGWLCEDVILYMAFVAIANFAQQNHELGYAFKFMRMMILALTAVFKIWGFVVGVLLFFFFVATNRTIGGKHHYLYPLIPWNFRAMKRLIMRTPKTPND